MNRLKKTLSRVLATPNKGSGRVPRARPQKSSRKKSNRPRQVPRRRRARTVNASWGRSLPAAYATHVRPRFNVMSRSATSARVAGCDLVYPMPENIQVGDNTLFAAITCNPAYWSGTRIAQFAPAYMNYRPLSITFSYIPQVAVTQAGTVFMGTVWNGAASQTDIQQTLVTSNGGCLTQCYVPCDTRINLGTNLSQNLFTLSGSLNPNTNPFLFMAGVRGANVVPGYFFVTYMYEFKNPIGQAWVYGRSPVLSGMNLPTTSSHPNSSLVLLNQSGVYGPGTVFDLESDGISYRGSPVSLAPDTVAIEFFNQQDAQGATWSGTVDRVRINDSSSTSTYFLKDLSLATSTATHTGKYLVVHERDEDNMSFSIETDPQIEAGDWFIAHTNTGSWITLAGPEDSVIVGGASPLHVEASLINFYVLKR